MCDGNRRVRAKRFDFFQSLLAQAQPQDLLRQLQDTPWGSQLTPGAPWDDCGVAIDRHLYNQILSLRNDSPDPTPYDLFLVQADYLNLKRALIGETEFGFLPGLLSHAALARIAGGDTSPLPRHVATALAAVDQDTAETERRALLDVILDGAYLRHMLELGHAMDVPVIGEYVDALVLGRAVVALLRAKRAGRALKAYRLHFLPLGGFTPVVEELIQRGEAATWADAVPGELGRYLAEALELERVDEQAPHFERLVANHLMRVAERGRYQTFGPERAFAFLVTLATEAYNLKLVVCGRMNRIDADLLRQRVRAFYG